MDASLIMRDRETDSWWSIMTSDAIGGELDGVDLVELPAGEKATFSDWKKRHPDTLVLSVGGEEHDDVNHYENYFASDGTFRDLEIDDKRLEPKTSIYSFWLQDEPWAVPHDSYEGGKIFDLEGVDGKKLFLFRTPGSAIFESTQAFLVSDDLAGAGHAPAQLLRMAGGGNSGIETLPGFDTFWYNWVAVNENTHLVQ